MSNELKGLFASLVTTLLVVISCISYNLYTNAKNRALYMECLKQAEKAQTDVAPNISTSFAQRRVSCYAY